MNALERLELEANTHVTDDFVSYPAPAPVLFALLNTATTTEYFIVDPDHLLTDTGAEQMARDRYYYDDAYMVVTERADAWKLGGKTYSGWLVKVLH